MIAEYIKYKRIKKPLGKVNESIELDSSFYRYDLDGSFFTDDLKNVDSMVEPHRYNQDDKLKPIFDMILSQLFGSNNPSYQDIVDFFLKEWRKVRGSSERIDVMPEFFNYSKSSFSYYKKLYQEFIRESDDGIYILYTGLFDAYYDEGPNIIYGPFEELSYDAGPFRIKEVENRAYYKGYNGLKHKMEKVPCEHLDYYKILYFKNSDGREVSFEQFLTIIMETRGFWDRLMISNKTGKILRGVGDINHSAWSTLETEIDFNGD